MKNRYIAVIYDVEQVVDAEDIAQAAQRFIRVWGEGAVVEVRRADWRDLGVSSWGSPSGRSPAGR